MFNIEKIQSTNFSDTPTTITSGTKNSEYIFFDSPNPSIGDNFVSSESSKEPKKNNKHTYKPANDTTLYALATIALPNGTKQEKVNFIIEVLNLNPNLKIGNIRLDNDGWPICNVIKTDSTIIIPDKYSISNTDANETKTQKDKTSEDISNLENMISEFGENNISERTIGTKNCNLTCKDFIYTVEQGNTLWRISNSYNIDLITLKQYNNLTSDTIEIGQKIKIPKIVYTVKKKDTLNTISKQFGISIDVLKDLNSIDDVNKIKTGQKLEISGYPYVVKKGDNLNKIAENAGVTLETLKSLNGLKSDIIQPGQMLLIVFNDADYNNTETKIQVSKTKYYKAPVTGRSASVFPYYRHHYENGKTVATKEVFSPTGKGKLNNRRIIINAGHGYTSAGHDPGTRHRNSKYDESEITYLNAMNLSDKLRAQGATVVYIQGGVNLAGNAISKEKNADMMVSIHVNSSKAKEVLHNRVEIYYNSKNCPKGKSLAKAIEQKIDNKHPRNLHYAETLTANHFVTKARGNNIPSVLVELGFLNNTSFRNSINNNPVQDEIVNAIYQSVVNYKF